MVVCVTIDISRSNNEYEIFSSIFQETGGFVRSHESHAVRKNELLLHALERLFELSHDAGIRDGSRHEGHLLEGREVLSRAFRRGGTKVVHGELLASGTRFLQAPTLVDDHGSRRFGALWGQPRTGADDREHASVRIADLPRKFSEIPARPGQAPDPTDLTYGRVEWIKKRHVE